MEERIQEVTVSQVVAALEGVIELHQKTERGHCGECFVPWPCRTVEILKKNFQ